LGTANANTAAARARDLAEFATFIKAPDTARSAWVFLRGNRGPARQMLVDWQSAMLRKEYSLATVRRRLSSLMSLATLACDFDIVPWTIRLRLPAAPPIRDTAGPGREAILEMLDLCGERGDAKGRRDRALIELLFLAAMRSREVLSLDMRHFQVDHGQLMILGKGRWAREPWPIPRQTVQAIEDWITARGDAEGPLFTTLMRGGKHGERLTRFGLFQTIRRLGRRVGVRAWPHGLRHSGITEALRLSNGHIAWAMALSRHSDPRCTLVYNDAKINSARSIMEVVAAGTFMFRPRETPYPGW
jgi:integrase/recombinase XerC